MKTFFILLIILLSGCHSTDPREAEHTEPALIFANGLASDGCSESIQLSSDSLHYVATSSSLPILQKALSNSPQDMKVYGINGYGRTVLIRYNKTGKQNTLRCGWGATRQVGELNVLEIRKY